jgi:hypothetical protein
MPEPPPIMKSLLLGRSEKAKLFKANARAFNSHSSFASVKMNQTIFAPGVPAFKLHGAVHHIIGPATQQANDNTPPSWMQCFFHGQDNDAFTLDTPEKTALLREIVTELKTVNTFYLTLKPLIDVAQNMDVPNYRSVIDDATPVGAGNRTFNAPVAREVAGLIIARGPILKQREIFLYDINANPNSPLRCVQASHSSYDPLSYTLLYPTGAPFSETPFSVYHGRREERGRGLHRDNSHLGATCRGLDGFRPKIGDANFGLVEKTVDVAVNCLFYDTICTTSQSRIKTLRMCSSYHSLSNVNLLSNRLSLTGRHVVAESMTNNQC